MRCQLHNAGVIAGGEVGVRPPTQAQVEAPGAIHVGHGEDDDLELHLDRPGAWPLGCGSLYTGVLIVASIGLAVSGMSVSPRLTRVPRGELLPASPSIRLKAGYRWMRSLAMPIA